MPHLSWHAGLMLVSSFAAIAGLVLLFTEHPPEDQVLATDRALLKMSFAYWLVYCGAVALRPLIPTDWEMALMSVKLTGVIAYLLTFTSILSLPLHRVSARQTE